MKIIPKEVHEGRLSDLCQGTVYSFAGWKGPFKGVRTRLLMNCAFHGKWEMYLPDFYKGVRCAGCKKVRRLTETEVLMRINEACEGKNFKFVSWESTYSNMRSKAIFECSEHGQWIAQYSSITQSKSGCPVCSKNGFDPSKKAFLYLFESKDLSLMKVGITNNIKRRFVELKRTTPFDFKLSSTIENQTGSIVLALEKAFHQHFESANLQGFNGSTEWLKYHPDIPVWFTFLNSNRTHAHSNA